MQLSLHRGSGYVYVAVAHSWETLFGFIAKAWREVNPELAQKNNVRDFATIDELTVLSNLESHNAQMIKEGKKKEERFEILKEIAEYQVNKKDKNL